MTRKPDSERAATLARQGIDIVKGDLDDEASLRRALAGAWGVFGVQNAGEAGPEREEAQGKRLATLAREAGVEHFVYTSVGSAHKQTGVPHFDNKWRIEETVRGLRFPSHVIVRPVFFMENLVAPFSLQGSTLAWALGADTKLQMIAVDDIGWLGALAFTDAAALNRREVDLAGDVRTMPESAEILSGALGRPIAFAQTPIEPVRQYSKEMALMLEWFERVGTAPVSPAWNASSAASSRSSPTGHVATRNQTGAETRNHGRLSHGEFHIVAKQLLGGRWLAMMSERRAVRSEFLAKWFTNSRRRQDEIFEDRSHAPASDHRCRFGNTGCRLPGIAASR